VLLGRARERQELDRLLASARSGRSAALALVGEAGIGKSALVAYAAEHADGLRVLRARGVESETNVPYAALFELLRPALAALERIPSPQAAALEGALALRPSTSRDRFAVGAATLSLLAAYADEAPALVLIDDAHLLDAPSAEALLFALRRLLAEPLGVVLAVRADEPSLLDAADVPVMRVSGLDRESAGALLGDVPGDAADRLHTATGGNPLALLELRDDTLRLDAAAIDAPLPVPAAVADVFARRAAALEDSTRRLLVLAAASDSGELATLQSAASSLGLDLADLDAAEDAGLIRLGEGRFEFRHPLARAAIYGEAAPERRREAHAALAAALPERELDRRAWHLAVAAVGIDEAAASALEQAGSRARERSAYATAADCFERAAGLAGDEQHRCRLLFGAADAAWLAGHADRAVALLAGARELGPDGPLVLEIEHLHGHIATRRGPVMEGCRILLAAAEQASASDPELAISMLAEAVDASYFAGDARRMGEGARRTRELVDAAASARARFLSASTTGMALVFAGQGPQGIASIREAVALAVQTEALREDPHLLPWVAMGPLWLREAETGRELIEAAIDSARARAALGLLPWLLMRIARDHAATDRWATARSGYDEAIRLARETGQSVDLASGLAALAWLEALEGRDAECRAHAAEARELCREAGALFYETWAVRALGELELGKGAAGRAVTHFEELDERLREGAIRDVDLSPGAELVDSYLRLGRTDAAADVAARFAAEAQAKGQPWSLARAERCRGLLAAEDAFEPHFSEALRRHSRTPDVFETGRTHLAFGERLRRSRQRVRAREQLGAALEIFQALGSRPWAALTEAELEATGARARRRDPSTLDELTSQELNIAQLLASGKTTREAAAALFLSPKTIEYHLRSIYRKLGVKSRDELGAALGGR
jgi:DNA-binding CsgD family transcriptional regulator